MVDLGTKSGNYPMDRAYGTTCLMLIRQWIGGKIYGFYHGFPMVFVGGKTCNFCSRMFPWLNSMIFFSHFFGQIWELPCKQQKCNG